MNGRVQRLDSHSEDFAGKLDALLARHVAQDPGLEISVREIVAAVRQRGDAAILDYGRQFDRLDIHAAADLEVPAARLDRARAAIPPALLTDLEACAERIRRYHEQQRPASWQIQDEDGSRLGQLVLPLDRVGLYVPGGRASYPSSVLMNAIPARVAGVSELIMTVPAPDGQLADVVLAAATVAGVDRVFTIGGAQAVAALAFGTATVPRVDKIVGPGNRFVAEAKRQVYGQVGLDMLAGPSEVLIITDGSVDAEWLTLDLFAQAEHDEQAQALLLSPDVEFLDRVESCIERLLPQMQRREIITRALSERGALIQVRDLKEAMALSNQIAPEHLELAVDDATAWLDQVRHAGAIFLGPHSAEVLGDYCVGPSHVLPTAGAARYASPLDVHDFVKRSSVIHCSEQGAARLARLAAAVADSEGLDAHARSARCRLGADKQAER